MRIYWGFPEVSEVPPALLKAPESHLFFLIKINFNKYFNTISWGGYATTGSLDKCFLFFCLALLF